MPSGPANFKNGEQSATEGENIVEGRRKTTRAANSTTAANAIPRRIGLVLAGLQSANLSAFRFLILQVNSLQSTFEFEFLPSLQHKFLTQLQSGKPIDRIALREQAPEFAKDYGEFLRRKNAEYKLLEPPPDYFVVISLARFADGFYTSRKWPVSMIALGNWKNSMAPPSILEFILTLLMREAVASICPNLRSSIHLGTKGCICDFTESLDEARIKVLSAFLCSYCSTTLATAGYLNAPVEIRHVLGKKWFGKIDDPASPAAITAKLGHNLFLTKGLKATWGERAVATLQEEGIKQLIGVPGAIVIAAILLWLGLKN